MKNDAPAEAALLYEIALANLHEYAFFVMDTHGVIQTWHPGVEAVFGYSRDAFLGYSGLMIFTEEQRRTGVPEYEMRMAAETGRANDERWHVRSDGTSLLGGRHHERTPGQSRKTFGLRQNRS